MYGPRVERHSCRESRVLQRSSTAPRSVFVIDISSYGDIANTYAALEVREAEEAKKKDTLRSILKWLDPVDTVSDYIRITDDPKKQACQWIRSNVDFARWLLPTASSPPVGPSLLWVNAKAGTGKTYVSARVIEDMEGSQPLAYFFCDVNDERKRSFLDILRTLTWQLLRQKPDQLNTLADAYDSGEQLSARLLTNALRQLIRSGAACRLVVDGLDECREDVRKSVLRLCELLRPEDKMLIASRPEHDIHQEIRKLRKEFAMVPIREEDNSRDIRAYLQEQIRDLNFRDIEDPDLNVQQFEHQVSQKLFNASKGMFMWVRLMIDELSQQMTTDELQSALDNLPSGLHEVYERVLNRINQYPPRKRALTCRMLQWITCSLRPLSVGEMTEALAIDFDSGSLNPEKRLLKPRQFILECCGSLIEIDSNTGVVRVAHASVQDYLEDRSNNVDLSSSVLPAPAEIQADLSRSCLTYLCYEIIECVQVNANYDESGIKLNSHLQKHSFLAYATLHWWSHLYRCKPDRNLESMSRVTDYTSADSIKVQGKILKSLVRFVKSERCTVHWLQILYWLRRHKTDFAISCFREVVEAFEFLDDKRTNIDLRNWIDRLGPQPPRLQIFLLSDPVRHYYLPIHIASFFDMLDFVQAEVHKGIDVTAINHIGDNPLYFSAYSNNFRCTEFLIEQGAEINQKGTWLWTPLMGAALGCTGPASGSAESSTRYRSAELLLEAGADVDYKDGRWGTAMHKFIISRPGDPDSELDFLHLLLSYGPDLEARDAMTERGRTPLDVAALVNASAVARILIEHGALIDESLHLASGVKGSRVASVLIEAGADTSLRRQTDGFTPLHVAARFGSGMGLLLLKSGANPNVPDENGRLPLHLAAEEDDRKLVADLIEHGGEWEAKDRSGKTPLEMARSNGSLAAAEVLSTLASSSSLPYSTAPAFQVPETEPCDNPTRIDYHPQNANSIFNVFLSLRYKSRGKLANSQLVEIIDLANYWTKSTKCQRKDWKVHEGRGFPPYVESLPISGRTTRPVQKVVFKIESHDQGDSWDTKWHGTYTESFTFFDIAVAKAHSQENEKAIEEHKLQDVRRLMHNIHADGATRTHTMHYDAAVSEVRDGEQRWYAGVRIDEEAQSRWVKSLGVGDVVVVIPKTQYRAWFNYVSFARIDVYSSWLSAPS